MKCLMTIVLLTICNVGQAQKTDTTLAIPKLTFDPNGELKITASATSSHGDFDFLVGKWKMHNRRLNKRLENCKDWTEFESSDASKDSRCGFSIRKRDCGACIGWPATSAFWTRP